MGLMSALGVESKDFYDQADYATPPNITPKILDAILGPYNIFHSTLTDEPNKRIQTPEEIAQWATDFAMAGNVRPVVAGGKLSFQKYDPMPELPRSPTVKLSAERASRDPRITNESVRDLALAYGEGRMPLEELGPAFQQALKRNAEGMSIFDELDAYNMAERERISAKPKTTPYSGVDDGYTQNVSQDRGSNAKTAGEIQPMDTSRGCVTGNCTSCYACNNANRYNKDFLDPQKVELKGQFADDPDAIRRFGETGEPNLNPDAYAELKPALDAAKAAKGGQLTQAEIDAVLNPAYDWSYTNEQIRNTGMDAPEAADNLFAISKLPSLTNFDPSALRNIQASIDTMNPEHFFRSLDHIQKLKEMDPTLNLQMRLKSVPSQSDEINALHYIASQFANKNALDTLETRTRFRKGKELELVKADDTLAKFGNQFGDASYFPRETAQLGPGRKAGGYATYQPMAQTEAGMNPVDSDLLLRIALEEGKNPKGGATKPLWEVTRGEDPLASGLLKSDALEMLTQELKGQLPGRADLRKATSSKSAGSAFYEDLENATHGICNAANGYCGTCQNCRTFVKKGVPAKD